MQRWLQLLLYTNPSGGTGASPLLQLAAARGRMMELIAGKLHAGQKELEDQAFMAGIMSLMPALMGTSLEEILKGINLASTIREALEQGAGELGTMLQLCEALEHGDGVLCRELCASLPGLQASTVNSCQTQALAWAGNIGRENPDNSES